MRKIRLFTPGPTPLIPEAQLAMAKPLIHHRTPEFKQLLLETRQNLKKLFKTEHEILILASSGTGAMEAAVSNLHSSGEKVVAVVAGKFGERWAELAKAFGLNCAPLCKEYGQAASPEEILGILKKNGDAVSLFLQGCETSTGTAHALEEIGTRVKREFPDLLIIVDAITALGSQPVEPDSWGLDVVIGGSQKAFGLPPGLAFLSLSPKAVEVLEAKPPAAHYYLNLRKELKGQVRGTTAFTPAISLITALNEATFLMLDEGIDNIVQDAELMARATREGLGVLGFKLLSSSPANAVTAAYPPADIAADDLRTALETEFGVKVAGGQAHLKGQIIRIAHLGYFDLLDVVTVLSAIELCLARRGLISSVGDGVRAALQELRAAQPAEV
jgi:aspartate aminotransferase-like enzyme